MEQPGNSRFQRLIEIAKIILLIWGVIVGLFMVIWPVWMFLKGSQLNLNQISSVVFGLATAFSAIAFIVRFQKPVIALLYSVLITFGLLLVALSPADIWLPKIFIWITLVLWVLWLVFTGWLTLRHYRKQKMGNGDKTPSP